MGVVQMTIKDLLRQGEGAFQPWELKGNCEQKREGGRASDQLPVPNYDQIVLNALVVDVPAGF